MMFGERPQHHHMTCTSSSGRRQAPESLSNMIILFTTYTLLARMSVFLYLEVIALRRANIHFFLQVLRKLPLYLVCKSVDAAFRVLSPQPFGNLEKVSHAH